MRKFGKDKPELMSFTLGNSKKVYTIPLAASMPATLILEMQKAYKGGDVAAFEFQLNLLKKYIGEAADELTAGDVRDIFDAWTEDSKEQGAEVGE